jgi:hypothetical protein
MPVIPLPRMCSLEMLGGHAGKNNPPHPTTAFLKKVRRFMAAPQDSTDRQHAAATFYSSVPLHRWILEFLDVSFFARASYSSESRNLGHRFAGLFARSLGRVRSRWTGGMPSTSYARCALNALPGGRRDNT